MNYEEAIAWLKGQRSTWNIFAGQDNDLVNSAKADAAMTEQAYWIVRAYKENLIEEETK